MRQEIAKGHGKTAICYGDRPCVLLFLAQSIRIAGSEAWNKN